MQPKKKGRMLNSIGILLLIIGIAAIINTLHLGGGVMILWLCYIYLITVGISVLIRNPRLLAAQLNIISIPLIVWNIDFWYVFFTKKAFLGIADYFFLKGPIIGKLITSQHLFSLPLAFFALYLIKLKRKDAWKISFIELIIVFIISYIFSNSTHNLNCVHRSCMTISFGPYYQILWFIVMFSLVLITNLIINKFFLKKGGK